MIPTIKWIEDNFKKYNELYFNNELPTPRFELISTKTILGQFQSCRRLDCMANPYKAYFIRLSTYYDRSEHDIAATLIHEQIHYWIDYKDIVDNGSHGTQWKALAEEINKKSDFNITRTTSVSDCQLNPEISKRRKKSGNDTINMFGYFQHNRWFVFCVGDTKIEQATDITKRIIETDKTVKGFYGKVQRTKYIDSMAICRRRIKGYYKSNDEFEKEILPILEIKENYGNI